MHNSFPFKYNSIELIRHPWMSTSCYFNNLATLRVAKQNNKSSHDHDHDWTTPISNSLINAKVNILLRLVSFKIRSSFVVWNGFVDSHRRACDPAQTKGWSTCHFRVKRVPTSQWIPASKQTVIIVLRSSETRRERTNSKVGHFVRVFAQSQEKEQEQGFLKHRSEIEEDRRKEGSRNVRDTSINR